MEKVKQIFKEILKLKRDINKILKIVLIIIVVLIILLSAILTFLLFTQPNTEVVPQNPQEEQNDDITEKKATILDIPSMTQKDAFEILDILVAEYGEPNPKGLIDILKEFRDINEPTFETVNWLDIKYGYNFTFNFWTDGSLAREDSYYIVGYKSKGHTVDEILELTKLEKDSEDYIFKITDLGGAVFNIGITPKEAALKVEPGEKIVEELTREEILEILEENANVKWEGDTARIKLEYDNQVKAYDWITQQTEHLTIMTKAKSVWGYDYIMVKWEYEKEVKAYEATLQEDTE